LGGIWNEEKRKSHFFTEDERKNIETKIGRPLEGHVITLKEGTQAYVSTYLRQPEMAKKNPKLMFLGPQDGGYFEKIFNNDLTADQFILAQKLFWQVTKFVKAFSRKKRRRDRVADWKIDYESLLGKSLIANYGDIVDQVIPQSVIFLSAIMFEIEVSSLGKTIDDLISELENENYSIIIEYLELLMKFGSDADDITSSWPTLLKSQPFYDKFSSYVKGVKTK